MLIELLGEQVYTGMMQALMATILALVVMWIARWYTIHIESELIVALLRGFVQILVVGSVLVLLLQGPPWTSVFILIGMTLAAATISAKRAQGIHGAFRVSLYGIGLGAGVVIVIMTWVGAIESDVKTLIPVGSMIIATAMSSNALALDRFRGELESHVGQIEAGLALGADPKVVVKQYLRAAVRVSLIPRIDALKSLGIVWIPGLMAGMIIAGVDPIYAAIYQFVVIAMLFAASGMTSLISTLLIRTQVFSDAEQLILRSLPQKH